MLARKRYALRAGFTMVELLISLTIFAVITIFVSANFRAGQRQDEVRFAAEGVAALIREALARGAADTTATTCVVGGETRGVCGASSPCIGGVCLPRAPRGWGVIFGTGAPSDAALLFADVNANDRYDPGEEVVTEKFSVTGSVQATSAAPDPLRTTILFVAPLPEVLINGGKSDPMASLTLEQGAGGARRTVEFNRVSRRIEITNP